MNYSFSLFLILFVNVSYAQLDTLHIAKKETTTLFSTIAGQAVKAKLSKQDIIKETRIVVNDTIKVSSYWFTCYSNGIQHQRVEHGEVIYGEVIREMSKLPIGGKAYFTGIIGYNIYTNALYKIYDLEIEIIK
jgi:hypothetical protein